MKQVAIHFRSQEGKAYRMSFEIDKELDAIKRIVNLTMDMLDKKHGVKGFICEIKEVNNKEEIRMHATKAITVKSLLERLDEEYKEFENEWLQMTPRELIDRSYDIETIRLGKEFIEFVVEDGKADLKAYERTENILAEFLFFQLDSLDGSITEETVREFEEYLLEEY